MRSGIDIRIDANRNPRRLALPARESRQQFQFGFGFDVDAEDVGCKRGTQFGLRLADPGKHDPLGRNARGKRALQLAARNHVGAGAEFCKRAQHRLVGVRLHGVTDQRLLAGEGLGKYPIMALQRRGRIAIKRRADRVGEFHQTNRLGVEHAVAIIEVIHDWLFRL